jgi:membrane associated rhomboid family serine protease
MSAMTPNTPPRANMSQPPSEPAINLPPLTLALIAINVAVFAALRFVSDGVAWRAIDNFGFTPERFASQAPLGIGGWLSPLTYMFLHGDWTHLGINMVTLAAFGAGIERRLGAATTASFYLLCGLIAAGAHYVVYPLSDEPVIGASGAISGLVGGVLTMMAAARRRPGQGAPGWLLGAAAMWAIPTVLFGIVGMPGTNGSNIAWVAHLGGFAGGLAVSAVLLSGGKRGS